MLIRKMGRVSTVFTSIILASFFGLSCSCAKEVAPNKRNDGLKRIALLVGVDQYGAKYTPKVSADDQWTTLAGTVNDTKHLGATLEAQGFEVTYLHNKKATQKGILKAIESTLLNRPNKTPTDILYFHFSGHGIQIADNDGDEADGYDESLVPYDNAGKSNGSKNIRDDALGALFDRIAAESPHLVVTIDSCHSGSATRGGDKEGIVKRGSIAMEKPSCNGPCQRDRGFLDGKGGKAVGYVMISGTRDVQQANEQTLDGKRMGAFTYEWAAVLSSLGPNTSYRHAHAILADRMTKYDKQNPQVEGAVDREVLGPGFVDNRNIIASYDGSRVLFKAGAVSNMVAGTTVAVFPKGQETKDWSKAPLTVTIKGNNISESWGPVAAGTDANKKTLKSLGGVARLIEIGSGGFKVKLEIDGAPAMIKETFENDINVMIVKAGTPGSYRFAKEGAGWTILDETGQAQLLPAGSNQAPLKSLALPAQIQNVRWAIGRLSRLKRIQYLKTYGTDPATIQTDVIPAQGETVIGSSAGPASLTQEINSQFRLKVTNKGQSPIVAHLAVFDADGMVTAVGKAMNDHFGKDCPAEKELIQPGKSFIFPGCNRDAYQWGELPGENKIVFVFAPKYLDHFDSIHMALTPQKRGIGAARKGPSKTNWGISEISVKTTP